MADKAKHGFGLLENVDSAIAQGKIDAFDILFVKNADGKPYVGWVDKNGEKIIVNDDAEFAALESELATKANAEEVSAELATKAVAAEVEAELATKADTSEVEVLGEQVATKAEASDLIELEVEVATKVTAEEVMAMIKESEDSSVEIVEF